MREKIEKANQLALERMFTADPVLVDVRSASDAIPGLEGRMLLHAGPPIDWERMCGPLQGAIAGAAGQKVHAYTSPHLVRFNERICVASHEIKDAALLALIEECEAANGGAPITFFEITTAVAFLAFARSPADLLLLETAWKIDQGTVTPETCAMTKLFCTEMLARVADQSLQTVGGMGLMEDLPLERIWRDARVERIWDGTSEIQRHIISRGLLRPLGA